MSESVSTDLQRLEQLISSRHASITITTHEKGYALSLIRDAIMKTPLLFNLWSINGGVRDGLLTDHPGAPETEHPAAALFFLLKQGTASITVFLDLEPHLRDERTLRLLRDYINHCRAKGSVVVLINPSDELPEIIHSVSARFEIALPNESEIESIARGVLRRTNEQTKLQIDINRREFKTIVNSLRGLTRRQVEQIILETVADDQRFDVNDLKTVLTRKRQMIQGRGLLEFIETPADLSEVGGLKQLKRWLKIRENIFSEDAAKFGLAPPRGILMLGVQGAGKSYCAKAIAAAWQRPLLRMDVGALYDRFVGESEQHLRNAFKQAEMMSPCVLWIDEIEKAFASAASRNVDGGLSQRMFGALLTWMQEHRAPTFIVATANDIEALPPELLRKGRFDEIFFVDLPNRETRRDILAIHLKKRGRDPVSFDLEHLADASDGFTGAELEHAIVSALHEAFSMSRELDAALIEAEFRRSPPLSVVQRERVMALRAWAAGRCVPAD